MPNFVSTANFSSSNAGLSTVGYAIYNLDGTVNQSRTTSGVVELGTSTGIYRTIITYPPFFQGFVLWDTGGGSPVYASESINPQDADPVLDGVRTQLRSLNTSLSQVLQQHLKKTDAEKLLKKLDAFKLEKPDYSEILSAIKSAEKAVSAINITPVVDFKPEIKPEVTVDTSKFEKLLLQVKDLITGVESAEKSSIKEFKDAVIQIRRETAESMRNEARRILNELNGLETRHNKVADNRLQVLTKAVNQMLSNVEARLDHVTKKVETNLEVREDYEKRLSALKDNMRDVLGAQLDMKKQERKLDEDSLKFLMATFRG